MRFYEYESKALFARRGLPVPRGGLARSAADARRIAEEIAGPVVLKSQVLSGGRMKAGAVRFADGPQECGPLFDAILPIVVNGQRARAVLVEERRPVAQEYFVSVTWDGRRKRPVLLFSDMGGIDIEEVAERHPEHVSKTAFSTILPLSPHLAREAVAASRETISRASRRSSSSSPGSSWTTT
jgi:succinyl-CoA synthetase beta subunit